MLRIYIAQPGTQLLRSVMKEIERRREQLGGALVWMTTEFCIAGILPITKQINQRKALQPIPHSCHTLPLRFAQKRIPDMAKLMKDDGPENCIVGVEEEVTAGDVE